ncbi:MAG TPA: RES family NAD+ phosphorylase, partial [Polyangia bacterium]
SVRPFAARAWRVVEAQHKVSTRRLCDTLEEQELLEEIIEEVKPPRPAGPTFAHLHFLLFTPFRHPPLPYGSRFGTATDRGIWYGALLVETCLAEKAYYQLLFAAGTKARLENLTCIWSAYQADVRAARSVDLTTEPFSRFAGEISSPTSYAATHALGAGLRAAEVAACVFVSARCPRRGKAIALFEPAFAGRNPVGTPQTWRSTLTGAGCEVGPLNVADPQVLVFPRAAFEVGGRLPAPGLR